MDYSSAYNAVYGTSWFDLYIIYNLKMLNKC